jgi:ankyrin
MKKMYKLIIYFLNIGRPVIIEVPHFASLRGKEREIVILRSDNGDTWREHTLDATEEAVQDVLNESFEGEGKICL